jgi:hypothetical protein
MREIPLFATGGLVNVRITEVFLSMIYAFKFTDDFKNVTISVSAAMIVS